MTYELAKQLKDAGFPLKKGIRETWTGDQSIFFGEDEINGHRFHYIYPTLSELIEACPKELRGHNDNIDDGEVDHLFRLGWSGEEWFADYEFYESLIKGESGIPLTGWGKTPDVAVAKLWLLTRVFKTR